MVIYRRRFILRLVPQMLILFLITFSILKMIPVLYDRLYFILYDNSQTILVLLYLITIPLFIVPLLEKYGLPKSHNVAIVGFPKSGKTTLIVSLFGDIFAGNISPVSATLKGTSTIERVNESLERLERGRALGPTKDQDRFSFRADVSIKKYLNSTTYKVEFGDFPGEDSEKYSNEYGDWLHNTEFFKWVVDSDSIIFVVDLGGYLGRTDKRITYIAKTSSAIRAAWQHFLEFNGQKIKTVRKHPLILVFTKADLFCDSIINQDWNSSEEQIKKLGFGYYTPPRMEIEPDALDAGKKQVMQDYAELINYLESEASDFQVIFVSSFGLVNGKRLGINDLLPATLPK